MTVAIDIDFVSGEFITQWGLIEQGDPDPREESFNVKHLMLITPDRLKLLMSCPTYHKGGVGSAYADGQRLFVKLEAPTGSWTWELFEAHFSDGQGPEIYLGVWPD